MSTETLFHMDYESRSEIALDERGLHNYLTHPSTKVLMAAYAESDHKIKLWQPHLEPKMPNELHDALTDPFVRVAAWNAAFERGITKYVQKIDKPISEWLDPSVYAKYQSMPGSLSDVGKIMGLKEDEAKDKSGSRLIKLFCEPAVESREGLFGATPAGFRDWSTDPEDWELFGGYCIQDVFSERVQLKKLMRFPLPPQEQRNWELDQLINERGMPTDMLLVNGARVISDREMAKQKGLLKEITGLDNPNSTEQMLPWLSSQGYTFQSLGKAFVARAMAGECDLTEEGREALRIRAITSKSSVNKFNAIQANVSSDGRLRYQFNFGGAARTLRWAGRDVQLQNLPRPVKAVEKKLDRAIQLVRKMDYDTIVKEFTNPLDVVISTIRASFQAPEGKRFVVADLSAIENITVGLLSRCEAILSVFREGRDPYLDFAVSLYEQPYDVLYAEWKAGDSTKRTNSKPASLGCSYRLSGGEEKINDDGDKIWTGLMGYARSMGVEMSQEDAAKSVSVFRKKFPEVVQLWYDMENAAAYAIRHTGQIVPVQRKKDYWEDLSEPAQPALISFRCTGESMLEMLLLSGRSLHYIKPRAEEEEREGTKGTYKKTVISYEGREQGGTRQWSRIPTHGGKLVENVTQAVARDVLVEGMHAAEKAGFEVVGHVHDELITLVDEDSPLTEKDLCECMTRKPSWCPIEIPLKAEGYSGKFYRKG